MTEFTPSEPVEILLIEDNPGDVRLTQEAFKAIDAETEFHTAADGEEAMSYVREGVPDDSQHYPDMILLDLNLPGIDGFTILDILGNELDYPPPPVLILSSSKSEEDIHESYERDANAYLTKPDSPDEFSSLAQSIEDFWIDSARHPPAPS